MLLGLATIIGGTHKARIIAILLVLHFGLAALNHYIEIGEIESDRQSLEAQFPDLGVACYDYIPWLIALSVTIFFAIGETFGVGFLGNARSPPPRPRTNTPTRYSTAARAPPPPCRPDTQARPRI